MKCSFPDRQAKNKKLVIRKGAYVTKGDRDNPGEIDHPYRGREEATDALCKDKVTHVSKK